MLFGRIAILRWRAEIHRLDAAILQDHRGFPMQKTFFSANILY
jgi:hypothetical protein